MAIIVKQHDESACQTTLGPCHKIPCRGRSQAHYSLPNLSMEIFFQYFFPPSVPVRLFQNRGVIIFHR
jgi:hypothetical protein